MIKIWEYQRVTAKRRLIQDSAHDEAVPITVHNLCLLWRDFLWLRYQYAASAKHESGQISRLTNTTGVTASVLAYESFLIYFSLDSVTIGAINSSYQAASVVGALLNFWLPNKYGREHTFIHMDMQKAADICKDCGLSALLAPYQHWA